MVSRQAMTFIEVIACLLIVLIGALAVTGLATYGIRLANRAQGMATALITAQTVLADPQPLGTLGTDWARTAGGGASGYLNGFYVRRTVVAETASVLSASAGTKYRVETVQVDVFMPSTGAQVASLQQRCAVIRP